MYRTISAIALTSLVSCLPAFAAGHGPVPPESFLQYSVGSVPELGKEVTISPLVRARLARHFHVSYAEIGRYVLHNLSLSTLQAAGVYRVACIRPDGHEYWIQSRLPAGTPVFTSRVTGQAVLKLACGNPMMSSLPPGQDTMQDNSKLVSPQISQSRSATSYDAAFVTPTLMTETPLVNAALVPGTEALLIEQPPVVKTAGSLEFAGLVPSRALNDLGPALAAAAAIAVASSGGGHNGSHPSTPSPIPEAPSSVAFGAMLLIGGVGGLFRKRRLA